MQSQKNLQHDANRSSVICTLANEKCPIPQTIQLHDGRPTVSSLQIAKDFGKDHSHVLRDIRALDCSDNLRKSNFGLSFYVRELNNGGQKKEPMYYMTRDGFVFLVMGYTGSRASKFKEWYISEFNRMEKELQEQAIKTAIQRAKPKVTTKEVVKYVPAELSPQERMYLDSMKKLFANYNVVRIASNLEDAATAYKDLIALGNGNFDRQKYSAMMESIRVTIQLLVGIEFDRQYQLK